MEQVSITLKSGKKIEPLTINGSMYVSSTEVTREDLSNEELAKVSIQETLENEEVIETILNDAICDSIQHGTYGWMFNLREKTELEKLRAENEMLTECLLEMSEIIYGE